MKERVKMPITIKAVNIHAFRGIPNLELELNGKNLLVRGENGTGKSSIIDAVEFFFRGTLSYFEGEGTQSLSLRRHVPHKSFSDDDVKIEMTFNPGGVVLSRTFEEPPLPPEQFEKYFQVAQRGTFILRRAQILKFIACRPADRFKAIASILGIESLDNVELVIKRVRDQLEGSVLSKQMRVKEVFADLSELLGKEVSDSSEVLLSVNKRAREVQLPTITSLDEVDALFEKMLGSLTKTKDLGMITKLNEILKDLETPLIDDKFSEDLKNLHEKMQFFLQDRTKLMEISRKELLEKGRQAIEEDEIGICPLCGQKIDREELLEKIDKRLRTLSALSDEASDIRKTSVPIGDRLNSVIDRLRSVVSNIQLFPRMKDVEIEISGKIKFLEDLLDKVRSAKELKEEIPFKEFHQSKVELKNILDSLSKKCESLLDETGVPQDWKEKYEVIRLIDQARSKINELSKIRKELEIEEKRCNLARKVYTYFSETKKAKIEEIYEAITEDLNSFYYSLHPKDPHKNIELSVASGRRASTTLTIESFGREGEDPRALTSEGHQDSLGLCIFLAFVKKFNEGCSLIMLDDVVTTIDAQHRELICKLLLEEFRNYQLIITTHDEIWYEQLRSHQRARGVEGKFVNLKIIRWDAETGPVIEPHKPRWDKIQEKIRSSDKQGAGNEGRAYLEWLLKKICEVTVAPVPYKTSGYTTADLLVPAKKRASKLVSEEDFKKQILQRFQNLESKTIMGNILSHDNPLIETVSIEEVKRFCESVYELHNIFCCPECGCFVKYYQDMKKLRCPNPKCKNPMEINC